MNDDQLTIGMVAESATESDYKKRILAAAIDYARKRKARAEAKKAWHNYLNQEWGQDADERQANGAHPYGTCLYEDDPHPPKGGRQLCAICAGSDPFYRAKRKAANVCAGAHRRLLHLVKSYDLIED